MTKEKLQLNRKFLVIESPIPFEVYCPEQDDGVKRRQGSWQMTIHDLLTKSHYPLNPIYNLELIYDETLLAENESVTWYTTDLNLGEALRGIDGQLVTWDYNEHLNVNDFVYNGKNKNTSRKIFDNKTDLLDYLTSNNITSVTLTGCFLNLTIQSPRPTVSYRYDSITGILYHINYKALNTYKVTMVRIFKSSNEYYLSFCTTDVIEFSSTTDAFDNIDIKIDDDYFWSGSQFIFEFI